jgi:hypothetical protein
MVAKILIALLLITAAIVVIASQVEPVPGETNVIQATVEKITAPVEAVFTPDTYIADYSNKVLERQLAIEQQFKNLQASIDKQQAYNCTRHTDLNYC